MASAESGDCGEGNKITLVSLDKEHFEVPEATASLSLTIQGMIEDDCAEGPIPLPNVTSGVLAKVLEYCNKHAAAESTMETGDSSAKSKSEGSSSSAPVAAPSGADKEDLTSFDQAFIDVKQDMLFDLILAANYLNIKGLLGIACQKVADTIKGKTPEEIRQMFGIKNDFTPEEEEAIRKENSWAFNE